MTANGGCEEAVPGRSDHARGFVFRSILLRAAFLIAVAPPLASAAPASSAAASSVRKRSGNTAHEDRRAPVEGGGLKKRWYGWQTLSVDAAALGLGILVGVATASDSRRVSTAGVLTPLLPSVFGSPIVHYLHGRAGTGLASFGLRLGIPAAGALLGATLAECPAYATQYECGSQRALQGATIAMMATITADATLLAWEPHATPGAGFERPPSITLTSRVNVTPGFVGVSLDGRM